MKPSFAFVGGVAFGAGLVALGVALERAGNPSRASASTAGPGAGETPGSSLSVADNAPLQPVAVAEVHVPLRFSRCTLEFVRDEQGTFTGRGRYLQPDEVLRKGRLKVAVIEAWYCKPCKRIVHTLAGMQLGVNVDLVVLGTGGASPGNHIKVVDALAEGTGWLYVEGFDAENLLESVFGKDHYATPSVLLIDGDNNVVAGIQTSNEDEITRWLTAELTLERHVIAGRDQPAGSTDPTHDSVAACFPRMGGPIIRGPVDTPDGPGDVGLIGNGVMDPFANPPPPTPHPPRSSRQPPAKPGKTTKPKPSRGTGRGRRGS